jgi:hypothetical protein
MTDIAQLTFDDLVDLKERCTKQIEAMLDGKRKTMWIVTDGICVSGQFQTDDNEAALEHYISVLRNEAPKLFREYKDGIINPQKFEQYFPKFYPRRLMISEYHETFPVE